MNDALIRDYGDSALNRRHHNRDHQIRLRNFAVSCDKPAVTDGTDTGDAVPRSTGARIGCAALNLIQPGLGLLRVGEGRMGGLLIALPILWLVASIVLFAVAPKPSFAAIMIFAATAVVGIGLLYVSAMVLTWRRGRFRRSPMPLWSRWYGLVAVAAIGIIASQLLVPIAHRYYKPFYIPSENMAPTLAKLDKIVADMRGGRNPSVGDIVLIQTAHGAYIKRVVALPGDRIAIRADIPIVNGLRAQVRQAGTASFPGTNGLEQATLFSETLPGENGSHDIAIIEPGEYADMAERTVPAGHIFVLGDNRDRSADSRVPPEEFGLGMVPMAHLIGRPLYITWSRERGRIGRPIGH